MKYKYYSVYETNENGEKRRVYTFDNENAAHDLVELLIRSDFMPADLEVTEHE